MLSVRNIGLAEGLEWFEMELWPDVQNEKCHKHMSPSRGRYRKYIGAR